MKILKLKKYKVYNYLTFSIYIYLSFSFFYNFIIWALARSYFKASYLSPGYNDFNKQNTTKQNFLKKYQKMNIFLKKKQ